MAVSANRYSVPRVSAASTGLDLFRDQPGNKSSSSGSSGCISASLTPCLALVDLIGVPRRTPPLKTKNFGSFNPEASGPTDSSSEGAVQNVMHKHRTAAKVVATTA